MGRVMERLGNEECGEAKLVPGEEFPCRQEHGRRSKRLSTAASAAAGVSSAIGVVALWALVAAGVNYNTMRYQSKVTVRELLEGDKLASVATKNIMALGGPEAASKGWNAVYSDVSSGFKNVSKMIKKQTPEVHRKLNSIQLDNDQQDAALRVLRKFSDSRMVGIAHEMVDVIGSTRRAGADKETTERRLVDRLAPRFADIKSLSEEMYPGSTSKINLDFDSVPALEKWHGKLQVDLGRRLSSSSMHNGIFDVDVQARTLFRSLHDVLGDEMPQAPTRTLFSLDDIAEDDTPIHQETFMDCLQKAVPNPVECVECASSHMSEVMTLFSTLMTKLQR